MSEENNVTVSKPVPEEIQGKYNWGAFLLSWIWGIGNKTYLPLVVILVNFVPFVGKLCTLALCIWFGFKGNEWAWQNKEWESVEHFTNVQKAWVKWGLIAFGACLVLGFVGGLIMGLSSAGLAK